MQDRAVVAAIVAGDLDGLAEAYDRYAAALYTSCHLMLSGPGPGPGPGPGFDAAAEAVRDTFIVATARLEGLRDPDRLGPWLHAVARNECLRGLGTQDAAFPPFPPSADADADSGPAAVTLPAGLRGQVLMTCADDTPTGRANRVSVAHRAGTFGWTGFPKAIGSPGPRWRRLVRRHPRMATAVAAVATAAVTAVIITTLAVGGSHRAHASALALGGVPASPSADQTAPSVPVPGGASSPGSPNTREAPASPSGTPASASPSPSPSPSASLSPSLSLSPSASASPSPSPSASQGGLIAAPGNLVLTSVNGKAASGTFVIAALDGPVSHYSIKVPPGMAAMIRVTPSGGSLSSGGWVIVTVTVTSKVALNTHVTVDPGAITVKVQLKIKVKAED